MKISDLSHFFDTATVVGVNGMDLATIQALIYSPTPPKGPFSDLVTVTHPDTVESTVCVGWGCLTRITYPDGTEKQAFSPFPFFSGEGYVKAGG